VSISIAALSITSVMTAWPLQGCVVIRDLLVKNTDPLPNRRESLARAWPGGRAFIAVDGQMR
jgi:hypothetical protein